MTCIVHSNVGNIHHTYINNEYTVFYNVYIDGSDVSTLVKVPVYNEFRYLVKLGHSV